MLEKLIKAINEKKLEVKNLVEQDRIEDATAAKEELKKLQAKFDLLKDMQDDETAGMAQTIKNAVGVKEVTALDKEDAIHAFADAARHRFQNVNKEGTGADGGYTVPEDIQTKINKYKEAKFSLQDLVDVESVTTNSGRRTYQTKAQHTGFTAVGEGAAIGAKSGPQFGVVSYNIAKYGGYLPVTNELLEDSDANIANTLIQWLGDEDIATRNALIVAKFKAATKTAKISSIDDIKTEVNVTLGSAYAGSVAVITNDDGFNWLDQLKKSAGSNEYLLKPNQDQTSPIKYTLAVGASNIPVVVVPNAILASTVTKHEGTVVSTAVPIFIGDAKEYVKVFDRKKLTIKNSDVATVGSGNNIINAFESDMTIFRGIERLDVEVKDADALVYGTLTLGE